MTEADLYKELGALTKDKDRLPLMHCRTAWHGDRTVLAQRI